MTDGWSESAAAWLADMGETGDFARAFVLDRPMLARVTGRGFRTALDIGCGEGRFCRLLRQQGIAPIGVDPTQAFLDVARARDPEGDYRLGRGEALPVENSSVDLAVSYLSLIDMPDLDAAIAEMARVLKPGGTLLIANMTGFATANGMRGWLTDAAGKLDGFPIDHYLEERAEWVGWRDVRIRNWHRPLRRYMSLLLGAGLTLRHFDEPAPHGGDPDKAERYRRAPYFVIMEWQK